MADTTKLFADKKFATLLHLMSDRYLPWSEFVTMVMPDGISTSETWSILNEVRKLQGVRLAADDSDTIAWYTHTHEMSQLLSVIDRKCSCDSRLYESVSTASGRPYVIRMNIDEGIATARLEGIGISSARCYEMLAKSVAPRNAGECLVNNLFRAVAKLENYVGEPFSAQMLEQMRKSVIEGVHPDELEKIVPASGTIAPDAIKYRDSLNAKARIDIVCGYANEIYGDAREHHAIRAFVLEDMFQGMQPLSNMNGFVGYLAFRLYTMKHGLPLLGILPVNKGKAGWSEDGKTIDSRILYPEFKARLHADSHDLTDYATLVLLIATDCIRKLEVQMRKDKEMSQAISDSLAVGSWLNHRQKAILGQAVGNPKAEFTIAAHKNMYAIQYATARADLLKLVARGLFIKDECGKAFIFSLAPKVRDQLAGLRKSEP